MIESSSTCEPTITDISFQGFIVPQPLRKYIPGAPEFLPYTKDLPKDTTSNKTKGKQASKAPGSADQTTKKMQGLQV